MRTLWSTAGLGTAGLVAGVCCVVGVGEVG